MSAPTTVAGSSHQSTDEINKRLPRAESNKIPESMRSRSVLDFNEMSKTLNNSMDDLDSYFTGPMDSSKYSKLPYFMRIRGSVLPGMILPMLFIAAWTCTITYLGLHYETLKLSPQLITVLGFLVGLALSFRSSTAYERYNEGRKYWAQLTLNARNLARLIWIHGKERPGDEGIEDVLAKVTVINLILAFCVSTKHKLRFEPEYDHRDLQDLVCNIRTFAKDVHDDGCIPPRKVTSGFGNKFVNYLGISFFQSNPGKRLKVYRRFGKHAGNMPFEIMNYINAYLDMAIGMQLLPIAGTHSVALSYVGGLMDALTGCERILQTPLPLAYNIVISQITWLYVLFLPFQLLASLQWVTIPAVLIASYTILGLAAIGREIENPFGDDVNDLDLDRYCESLSIELDILTSSPPPQREHWITTEANRVMFPNTTDSYIVWKAKGEEKIRQELREKPYRHLAPSAAKALREEETRQRNEDIDRKIEEQQDRVKAEEDAQKRESDRRHHATATAVPDNGGDAC